MSLLFSPGHIGSLQIPNRLVRSATAERMADPEGRPRPMLYDFYHTLARGGVGLIITGHMYVLPAGKAHPEMTGIYSDALIPGLAKLADIVHQTRGAQGEALETKIVVQINHSGAQCSPQSVPYPVAPSAFQREDHPQAARPMTIDEIEETIDAYAQAARRVKAAGFDGVQIHAAHGYLISQFLSPYINQRKDEWGGEFDRRVRFLQQVYMAVRQQVGPNFPVMAKLGMMDGVEGGLSLEDAAKAAGLLEAWGLDALEVSSGYKLTSIRKGVRRESEEAYFLPQARRARQAAPKIPLMLVGGMRSRTVMERVLTDGEADFISMCRPLISEPDFPNRMRLGLQERSRCISSNNCWAETEGVGIGCKCPIPTEA